MYSEDKQNLLTKGGLEMSSRTFTTPKNPYPELTPGLRISIVLQTKPGTQNSTKPESAEIEYTVANVTKELVTLKGDEKPRLTREEDWNGWRYMFAKDGYRFPVTKITVVR